MTIREGSIPGARKIMQESYQTGLMQSSFIRTGGMGWFWLVVSAFSLGILTLGSGQPWLLHYFVPAAYFAILYSSINALRAWRDPFNPLCLVLAVGFLRFFLPGILILSGANDEQIGLFQLMKLTDDDWQWAHALALVGMLAVVLGWLLVHAKSVAVKALRFELNGGVKYASIIAMAAGFTGLAAFFVMNASPGAILSGEFRSTTIQEGTGKYFFMAYLLISGSATLCCYLVNRGFTWLALIPSGISMLSFWPLGGRGRAVMSVAAGLILLWYRFRQRQGWQKLTVRPAYLFAALFLLICTVSVFYLGDYYRGNTEARAASDGISLSGMWDYSKSAIYTDIGQLHSLAGAIAIGPAVLGGDSFIGSLSWPLSKFIALPSRSSGVYLVETLVGFVDDRKWALNSSLIGDAYLNFGLPGIVAVMVLYGALLKQLYLTFLRGGIHIVIYVLATLYGVNMLWVSIEVWPQALTVLCFAFAVNWLGRTVFQPRGTKTRIAGNSTAI